MIFYIENPEEATKLLELIHLAKLKGQYRKSVVFYILTIQNKMKIKKITSFKIVS